MRDLNAKVGKYTSYEHVMGKHGAGLLNENGELILETCNRHRLVVGGTLFKWVSPYRRSENQIDNSYISYKLKHNVCA